MTGPTLSINANTPFLQGDLTSLVSTVWYRALAGLLAAQIAPLGNLIQITDVGAGNYSVDSSIYTVVGNCGGTLTLKMPDPGVNQGRVLVVKTVKPFAVISDSFNITPLDGSAVRDAIVAPVAGKWAQLQSDGNTWNIVMSN